jgi:hypothetical protein
MENMLILAPKDTKITVDSKVLIVTGLHYPRVATVKHIQEHSDRCTLIADNDEEYYRYVNELKPLMLDKTPVLGVVIEKSGDGSRQYDWVKTTETIFEPKEMVLEKIISFEEYDIKTRMQEFKRRMSVEDRTTFVKLFDDWGKFNTNEAESRAAEDAAGEDL